MLKKPISATLIALVVAIGIPASAFADDMDSAKVVGGVVESVTSEVNSGVISENVGDPIEKQDSVMQNQEAVNDQSGNLLDEEEPVVEEPVVTEPAIVVEEPAIEEPQVEEPAINEPAVEPVPEVIPPVEEPIVTVPAIVVEEVVTQPAIVVEPVLTNVTITQRLNIQDEFLEYTVVVEGLEVGAEFDITPYIVKDESVEFIGKPEIIILEEENNILLEYNFILK